MWLRDIFFNHLFVNLFNPFFFSFSISSSSLQQLNKIQCSCMAIINYLVGVRAYWRARKIEFITVGFFFRKVVSWEDKVNFFSLSLSQYEVSSSFAWKKESHHHLVSAYWIKIERKRRRRKKNSLFFFLSLSRSRFSSRLCIIGGDIISSSLAQLD